jgi:adenosylcobinamide hydrolase
MTVTWSLVATPDGPLLAVDLGAELRAISSAVLGGGIAPVRTWVNLQVPSGYARTDPQVHLATLATGLPGPVVGMLTAAPVAEVEEVACGVARVFATVGLGIPLAAAGDAVPLAPGRPGTVNILAVLRVALTDAGLVGAVQTAVEAKAQALAAAGIRAVNAPCPATGTASDALAVACLLPEPGAAVSSFCGPATPHGADLARAVFEAVRRGSLRSRPA